jgi:hypothetical protein
MRRGSMWGLASGVAAIAAIVSYSHIYDLGRAHGGTGVSARLLPLSVDMLILVGELMLLHEADAKGRRFMLGWVLVWSGILATLAANVTYGAQFGILGALIWGWPAYSFILAAGGMVAIVKRAAARQEEADPEPAADTKRTQKPAATWPPARPAKQSRRRSRGGHGRRSLADTQAAYQAAVAALPDASVTDLAAAIGVSPRTVRRVRAGLNGHSGAGAAVPDSAEM